jgi:hypothetical protein
VMSSEPPLEASAGRLHQGVDPFIVEPEPLQAPTAPPPSLEAEPPQPVDGGRAERNDGAYNDCQTSRPGPTPDVSLASDARPLSVIRPPCRAARRRARLIGI